MTDLYMSTDTIAAPATVPGTGAVSIIRVSGAECFKAADAIVKCRKGSLSEAAGYTVHYGTISVKNGDILDEVLVSVFRAPHSYTGEDSVEICCHASSFIVREILSLLGEQGVRMAQAGEFTRRAFMNGKMDLSQAESVADLIASQDAASHRVAINQLRGGISKELKALRVDLLEMSSLMELELDFSEEDVEFADRQKLEGLLDKAYAKVTDMADSFRLGNAIKNGVPVTIAGPANAGKSTLLNALVGDERAIVSDIAGTTRDSIEETCVVDGVRFRFIDTAGIRDTQETIEKMGIERTYLHMENADVVLVMLDGKESSEEIGATLKSILHKTDPETQRIAVILNKIDAICCGPELNRKVDALNNAVSSIDPSIVTFFMSAKTQEGLSGLKKWLSDGEKALENSNASAVTITNQRHYEALCNARESLDRVRQGLASSLPTDLVAQDIREVLYHLGSIVGEISTDEVLGNIFRNFCIGK